MKPVPSRRPTLRSPLPAGAASELERRTGPTATWFRDIRSEMKKVAWPSREEAGKLTALVLAISVIVGFYLGAIDALFAALVTGFLQ